MSVTLNTQAMKYRETTADEWAPVTIQTEAEVNAVVQDTEPTGNENVWFDTSDESEVVVPTMNDFNQLNDKLANLQCGKQTYTQNAAQVSTTIYFPKSYDTPPTVILTLEDPGGHNISYWIYNVTTTYAILNTYLVNYSTQFQGVIHWMAFE